MKLIKIFFYIYLPFAICYFLTGCVSVPNRKALPTYNLHGVTYLSLVSLCDLKGVNWEYDTFTRTVTLTKDSHKINLMVGDTLVLVDGKVQHLRHPVDIYQGAVVLPYKFKQDIFEPLFKESLTALPAALLALRIKKVIIDAGHGGTDPGAIGRGGLREKDVTLDIAKRLAKLLKTAGMELILTRATDRLVSLSDRVNIAENSHADLFISIHANANRIRSLKGFEVYYVSSRVNDSQRALSASKETALDFDNTCFASDSLNLKATLWDMIYSSSRAESIELSRYICQAAHNNLDAKILGIKDARFYVLKGTHIPAVLIEIGFLSNYDEERLLKDIYYRQRIAEALAQGIKNYARDYTLMEAKTK
jgi:N-acetylmuramoyl-L-alanine amidase